MTDDEVKILLGTIKMSAERLLDNLEESSSKLYDECENHAETICKNMEATAAGTKLILIWCLARAVIQDFNSVIKEKKEY